MSFGSVNSVANYVTQMQRLIGNTSNSIDVNISYKGSRVSSTASAFASNDSVSFSIKAIQQLVDQQKSSAVGSTSSSNTAQALDDKTASKNVLSDPASVFKNYVNSLGGPEKWSDGLYSKVDQQSFIKAFNEGTLNVQSAVDVKGLDYNETTTLTATSESGSLEINHAWYDSQNTSTQTGGLVEFPAIGGLYYTFPKSGSVNITS